MSFALILLHYILFIPNLNCPELFTLLAFLFMQEYREKNMDKKMAKKPTDQNSFHGTNKYTNGSHGYISVFFVLFYFPLQNKYSPKTLNIYSRICQVPTKHMRVKNLKTGQRVCSTI